MNLSEMVDAKLLAEQEKNSTRVRSGKFSPSSFGRCYRLQVYNRLNTPQSNPPDIRALRIFKVGNLFHNFIQALLPEHRIEVKVENDLICGYADIVVDEDKAVWDIKSQHSGAFHYMSKTDDIEKEKYTNILQVMTYVYLLGLEWGKLCFVSKDDLCIAQYSFHISKWTDRVMEEISALLKHWVTYTKTGELPPAEPRAYNGKDCDYCNFRDTCFSSRGLTYEKPAPKPRAKKEK